MDLAKRKEVVATIGEMRAVLNLLMNAAQHDYDQGMKNGVALVKEISLRFERLCGQAK